MPKPIEVTVRIADVDAFQEMVKKLHEIADADSWSSADDVRQQIRETLEAFVRDSP